MDNQIKVCFTHRQRFLTPGVALVQKYGDLPCGCPVCNYESSNQFADEIMAEEIERNKQTKE